MSMSALQTGDPVAPTSNTGIYLFQHEHRWRYAGARRYPVGTWHPLFRCEVCTDVICDLHVTLDPADAADRVLSIS